MDIDESRKLAMQYIKKDKWWDILSRFIDVLSMNIFIVDTDDRMLLPPEEGRFGGRLFSEPAFDMDIHRSGGFIARFENQGEYLEDTNRFGFTTYAMPINITEGDPIGYMVIGPIILNKRLTLSEYVRFEKETGVAEGFLVDEVSELRVVSNIMMNSIMELLSEMVRECMDKSIKEEKLELLTRGGQPKIDPYASFIDDITNTVRVGELLVTLLDSALTMTNSECGSIMLLNKKKDELSVKVSRGLDSKIVKAATQKMGEGIAGIAALEKRDMIIKGEEKNKNNRIGHLLKRPEVKHALIVPLTLKGEVFGVLNLHTKNQANRIEHKLMDVKHLTNLISAVI